MVGVGEYFGRVVQRIIILTSQNEFCLKTFFFFFWINKKLISSLKFIKKKNKYKKTKVYLLHKVLSLEFFWSFLETASMIYQSFFFFFFNKGKKKKKKITTVWNIENISTNKFAPCWWIEQIFYHKINYNKVSWSKIKHEIISQT